MIAQHLATETDESARRALVLCLGDFNGNQLTSDQRARLLPLLLKWYEEDPDSGMHSAVEWLLRHGEKGTKEHNKELKLEDRKLNWGQRETLVKLDAKLAGPPTDKKNWYVTTRDHLTMAVVRDPPEFSMGTLVLKPEQIDPNERPHRVRIPRSFALATKEITVGLFREFLRENPKVQHSYPKDKSPMDDGPMITVNWFQATQFCNWLSKRENIPPSQWCYPNLDVFDYGMVLPTDYLHRQGYRLPTEAEWEYACRAGAVTSRFYGDSDDMLKEFAWYSRTSNRRAFPVGQLKPNDLGFFDIYGNVMEWCQDEGDNYPVTKTVRIDEESAALTVTKAQARVLRGGSFFYNAQSIRSAFRDYYRPDFPLKYVGFRPARTMP
jgi:formylglycine-generating enzyme required for sulfatase activity